MRARIAERLRNLWELRPALVTQRTVMNLRADLMVAGGEVPERGVRFRVWVSEVWYHRPKLTTFARYDEHYERGMSCAFRHIHEEQEQQVQATGRVLQLVSGGAA
jgi:hypothetical protein